MGRCLAPSLRRPTFCCLATLRPPRRPEQWFLAFPLHPRLSLPLCVSLQRRSGCFCCCRRSCSPTSSSMPDPLLAGPARSSPSPPGTAAGSLTVASSSATDRRMLGSANGSCVAVIAPGGGVLAVEAGTRSGLVTLSGTPMPVTLLVWPPWCSLRIRTGGSTRKGRSQGHHPGGPYRGGAVPGLSGPHVRGLHGWLRELL